MTIPRRTVHLLATGLLLLVLAYALPGPAVPPVGNEATVLGATASVWKDGDLRFERQDMVRAERAWHGDVRGLELIGRPGADGDEPPVAVYATPFLYPWIAAPVYGLLGARGLRVLGVALYLLVFWVSWSLLGHPRGCRRLPRSGLTLTAFFFASAALVHALVLTPTTFEMAALFVGLALWCRVRERPLWGRREVLPLATAGVLVAAAFSVEPALGVFALPPVADLLWSRRVKAAATFAVAAVLAGLLAVGVQQRLTGPAEWTWGWGLADRAEVFSGALPFEAAGPTLTPTDRAAAGEVAATAPSAAGAQQTGQGERRRQPEDGPLLRNLRDLVIGRHVGLVPYFPFAVFALGLYLVDLRRPGGRTRHLLAVALLVYLVAVAARLPSVAIAPAAPGLAALVAIYPLFLFLPWRLRAGKAVLLPFLAAGLWAGPALLTAVYPPAPEAVLELPARGPTFRPLPLEISLLTTGRLPGYAAYERPASSGLGVWLVPREVFFHTEPNPEGVWIRGASRAEVYVVFPVAALPPGSSREGGALPAIRFEARSISAENVLTLEGARGRTVVRFDSEAKRLGTPVTVWPERVALLGGSGEGDPSRVLGRFVIETTGGAVPAHVDPGSDDRRYLGTFLAFD